MCKQLDPKHDIAFIANARVGTCTSKPMKVLSLSGHPIADEDCKRPLKDSHQHLLGAKGCVSRKLEDMGNAIIQEDWPSLVNHHSELQQLKIKKVQLTRFFAQQIEDAVVRYSSPHAIDTLRHRLTEIGASTEVLDAGYEAGYNQLKQLQSKKRH